MRNQQRPHKALALFVSSVIVAMALMVLIPLASAETSPTLDTSREVFNDLPENYPYMVAIKYLQDQNIVHGVDGGQSFEPKKVINRAAFLKMVTLMYEGVDVQKKDCYQDAMNMWFEQYVCEARDRGYIDAGQFVYPDRQLNAAEAAKILSKAYKLPVTQGENWYEGYINALAAKKALPPTIVSFSQSLTRGEIAEMMYRLEHQMRMDEFESQTYSSIKANKSN